ncbi:UDP-N-acetylmuramoyl-tripeptide--D-alanyl-D-alanine ligase [Corynebacterium sp. sy017]|uniref:UDP-N-acetylmuramoyl-tripeptide--D-alanyl-D- alanine ligase n=1 Tax=unclassified Corynebacterium TaxID=2624378 RepID=UPI0011856A93|nr:MULTISPECIES: UDP-N-acetylmuramoyl-tripeptide--D-alanyl-D-alanine ligase [unclassified Corynebacterium]MBP3087963.1 UDP-N-acetylmuramoyl-tripeptide--D-alanyl-D-alanine ligase [Corynebacterium sp. sy017]TSD92495.1 UDP-N-acetylmuramoyl-tripeptide--D-alanyl-D-alanine ligase [Corynebacterium sp. SY003]
MLNLTLGEIARIVGGTVHGDPEITITGAVEFDSRKINQGDLFVALGGTRVDGHDFAVAAQEKGAHATLAFRPVETPAVLVPALKEYSTDSYATEHDRDGSVAAVLAALGKLARYVVDTLAQEHHTHTGCQTALTVIGVTGSAGKTSTKDMMASIFSAQAPTVAPPGSFNNEVGHPYTVLRCNQDTQYLIAELSARGIGHVAHLAAIAPPHIGVVLNVGSAHLGQFGSRATIAQAKGELVEALADTGSAILNADDEYVVAMAQRTKARVLYFSATGQKEIIQGDSQIAVDFYATDVTLDELARPQFQLHVLGQAPRKVHLAVHGKHQVANALAAIAAAYAAGISTEQALKALEQHHNLSAHRMDVRLREDNVMIINDAYNANPESMKAGIEALISAARHRENARSWAVLGAMGELGDDADTAHRLLGEFIAQVGVDKLMVVGDNDQVAALAESAGTHGVDTVRVADNAQAIATLTTQLAAGDVVLLKASHAAQLWTIGQGIADSPG